MDLDVQVQVATWLHHSGSGGSRMQQHRRVPSTLRNLLIGLVPASREDP